MLSGSNNLILDMLFFININIFRHLKLEIALAIPASNDEKYNWSNSVGQGLKLQSDPFTPLSFLHVCQSLICLFYWIEATI